MKSSDYCRGQTDPGFSLIEVMTALFLVSGVATMALTLYTTTFRQTLDGTEHLNAVAAARRAEQILVSFIQQARAVGSTTNGLEVVSDDLTVSSLRYQDQDGNPETLTDNILELDPDISTAGNESVLCRSVSPIPGETMFNVLPSSPRTAVIIFHVGDRPPVSGPGVYGKPGHPGIEIRCAATPRGAK